LPDVRRSGSPPPFQVKHPFQDDKMKQSITFFKESTGETFTTPGRYEAEPAKPQLGKQPPRFRFFLNPYRERRFTTCPQCRNKTRERKMPLLVRVIRDEGLALYAYCRYCPNCDLLIVHQDELEKQIPRFFDNQQYKDYKVLGTIDLADWKNGFKHWETPQNGLKVLHDFKEVVMF